MLTIFPQRLAINIQNYEQFLSTSATQDSVIIRGLLGDPWFPVGPAVTTKLAAKHSHQVSVLLTAYRLLDMELLYNRTSPSPLALPAARSNCITHQMVENPAVMDRWRKLDNWQKLIIEFQDCCNGVFFGEKGLVSIDESPFCGSIAHLQGLAESHSNQKIH